MTEAPNIDYQSEHAALQRALLRFGFVALAADHARWTARGPEQETVATTLKGVARIARACQNDFAVAMGSSGVAPDARPWIVGGAMSGTYVRTGWLQPADIVDRTTEILRAVRIWTSEDRDRLLARANNCSTPGTEALSTAIARIETAIATVS